MATWTTQTFEVHWFVRYADPDSNWTPANAEDAVDDLEQQIMQGLHGVRAGATHWIRLAVSEASAIEVVTGNMFGGVPYIHEFVKVAATVRDPLVNRKMVRQAIGAVLTQYATLAQAVYNYQVADIRQSPLVYVSSAGSDRQAATG